MKIRYGAVLIAVAVALSVLAHSAEAQMMSPPPLPVFIPPPPTIYALPVPSSVDEPEDKGEELYAEAVGLWQSRQLDQAEVVLRDFQTQFARHPRATFVIYLLGRIMLETGRLAPAEVMLWQNYRSKPEGPRAAESLFYYTQAFLMQPAPSRERACQNYDYIEKHYQTSVSTSFAGLISAARLTAHCVKEEGVRDSQRVIVANTPATARLPIPGHVRRLALVIGNGAYGPSLRALVNPVNDAILVAAVLRRAGFEVESDLNIDHKTMKIRVAQFVQRLSKAGKSSVGLFYFAGHGIQVEGANYLVPVKANIRAEADVDSEAIPAEAVIRQMDLSGSSTNIIIIDACRNTPIAKSLSGVKRGLGEFKTSSATFIGYSTAPGSIAADGDGPDSPFTEALVSELPNRGEEIEVAFRKIRRAVLLKTNGQQRPWDASSLSDPFAFFPTN